MRISDCSSDVCRPIFQGRHWWVIAGVGVVGTLAQVLLTEAFRRGEASMIAPLEYTALVWGVLLDLTVWHVLPDGVTWLGAGIIVASGLYLIRRERVRNAEPIEPVERSEEHTAELQAL